MAQLCRSFLTGILDVGLMTTSAFTGTYPVELPTSGLLGSERAPVRLALIGIVPLVNPCSTMLNSAQSRTSRHRKLLEEEGLLNQKLELTP